MKRFLAYIILLGCFVGLMAQQSQTLSVYFETNKAILKQEETLKLDALLDSLDFEQVQEVEVEAYCDEVGDLEANEKLSAARANYILQYLQERIAKDDIIYEADGYGEIPNKGQGTISTDRAQNRRTDITITLSDDETITLLEASVPPSIPDSLHPLVIDTVTGQVLISFEYLEKGDTFKLKNIHFRRGTPILLPESMPTLEALVEALYDDPMSRIKLLGHVHCLGCIDGVDDLYYYQHELSQARSLVVAQYLLQQGIDFGRIEYKGLKGKYPLGRNPKYNMRVEVEFLGRYGD